MKRFLLCLGTYSLIQCMPVWANTGIYERLSDDISKGSIDLVHDTRLHSSYIRGLQQEIDQIKRNLRTTNENAFALKQLQLKMTYQCLELKYVRNADTNHVDKTVSFYVGFPKCGSGVAEIHKVEFLRENFNWKVNRIKRTPYLPSPLKKQTF